MVSSDREAYGQESFEPSKYVRMHEHYTVGYCLTRMRIIHEDLSQKMLCAEEGMEDAVEAEQLHHLCYSSETAVYR